MIFSEAPLAGVFIIDLQPVDDERGFFARSWCRREFEEHGLDSSLAQCNISFSPRMGTLRGMHYQHPPCTETKLVRCTQGALHDVIIDLRFDSPTFLKWFGMKLSAENRTMLYIPKGIAHGFQSLVSNTEVYYQMSEVYAPDHARGVRWDDPLFGIQWPEEVRCISSKDQAYPNSAPEEFIDLFSSKLDSQ